MAIRHAASGEIVSVRPPGAPLDEGARADRHQPRSVPALEPGERLEGDPATLQGR